MRPCSHLGPKNHQIRVNTDLFFLSSKSNIALSNFLFPAIYINLINAKCGYYISYEKNMFLKVKADKNVNTCSSQVFILFYSNHRHTLQKYLLEYLLKVTKLTL